MIPAAVGLAMGCAIYAAKTWGRIADEGFRFHPEVAAALALVCAGGFAALLMLREGDVSPRLRPALVRAFGWGIAWAIPAAWVFHRAVAYDFSRGATLFAAMLASTFLAAPFLRAGPDRNELRYPKLFARMCDNILAAGAGICVQAIFALVARLGAELFSVLGIGVLEEWIETDLFAWTAYPAVFAAGTALPVWRFRELGLAAFRIPAVVAAALSLAFAAALLIVGPAPLWEQNIAAPLLMALTIALLFFTNAAWRDGEDNGNGNAINEDGSDAKGAGGVKKIMSLSLLAAPLFPALAAWGIWLRIEQYGLTPLRMWSACAALFLCAASALYFVCAAKSLRGGRWLFGLRRINPPLAWVFIAVAFLSHTPALDPARLSAASQLSRVAGELELKTAQEESDSGTDSGTEFESGLGSDSGPGSESDSVGSRIDLAVFYGLGGYGASALSDLRTRLQDEQTEQASTLIAEMESLKRARDLGELDVALATRGWDSAPVYGDATASASEIIRAMKSEHPHWNLSCDPPADCALLALNLTGDESPEHCLIRSFPRRAHIDCFIRAPENGNDDGVGKTFKRLGGLIPREGDWSGDSLSDLLSHLRSGDWRPIPATVNDVIIGNRTFFLSPNRRDGH